MFAFFLFIILCVKLNKRSKDSYIYEKAKACPSLTKPVSLTKPRFLTQVMNNPMIAAHHYRRFFKKKAQAGALVVAKPPRKLNRRQKSQVYRMLNSKAELKYFDTNSTSFQQYGSGAGSIFAVCSAAAQGVGGNQRVGDQIDPVRIEIRFSTDQQTTNPQSTTRLILFQYRLNNVVAPTNAAILDPSIGGVATVWSAYNFDLRHQYTILWDISFVMSGSVGSSIYTRTGSYNIPLTKKAAKVNFDAGSITGDHHIYLLVLGSNANGATGQLISIGTRLFFRDS